VVSAIMRAVDSCWAPDPQAGGVLCVAIVGLGPRGLSVLERLLVRLATRPAARRVLIWAIDQVEHGPGRVWRTDQPWWLTMNATAGEVTVRSPDNHLLLRDSSTVASDFVEWTARDVGPQLQSTDSPERRHYGRYLREVFHNLCAGAPPGVRVEPLLGTVTGLHRVGGSQWLIVDNGQRRLRVDKVVLATGHAELMPPEADRELRELADDHRGLRYIGQGLSTDMPLAAIAPGSSVAVRGLGLTFYDVLRSLTLGRGGRFARSADGTLRYVPSGLEPVVLAGSRGGLPFLSRARVAQPPQTAPSPVALTAERISALRAGALTARGSPQLDFAEDVQPLIQHEMEYAYYSCAVQLRSGPHTAQRFSAAYRRLLDDQFDPPIEQLLAANGLAHMPRLEFQSVARPFDDTAFASTEHFRRQLTAVLRRDVAESRKGTGSSPLKAAFEALRALRPALPSVVDFGGLLPGAHRDFVNRWTPMSYVLSAGPPVSHIEQMVALLEAGTLHITGPATRFSVDKENRCFTVESPVVPGSRRTAAIMLDARMPTTELHRDTAPLVRQLLAEGRIREFVNIGPNPGETFCTGGLLVTPSPSRIIDAADRPDPDLYAIGVATDHTRWFTQVGTGRPGQDSPFSRDADDIALDVLNSVPR
jgi:hypothetical protein